MIQQIPWHRMTIDKCWSMMNYNNSQSNFSSSEKRMKEPNWRSSYMMKKLSNRSLTNYWRSRSKKKSWDLNFLRGKGVHSSWNLRKGRRIRSQRKTDRLPDIEKIIRWQLKGIKRLASQFSYRISETPMSLGLFASLTWWGLRDLSIARKMRQKCNWKRNLLSRAFWLTSNL